MKKLLILLFSLLISFNSYAGSLDGIGLDCGTEEEYYNKNMYIWFENNLLHVPMINEYEIIWSEPYPYRAGTKFISFADIPMDVPYSVNWWRLKSVSRETLKITGFNPPRTCIILNSKQQIIDVLNQIIDDAKSTNKI